MAKRYEFAVGSHVEVQTTFGEVLLLPRAAAAAPPAVALSPEYSQPLSSLSLQPKYLSPFAAARRLRSLSIFHSQLGPVTR